MTNLTVKFEVSMFTHHEDTIGNAKCEKGHRQPKRVYMTSYSPLIQTMHLSYTTFELQ